jgi:Tfp pilus assembly protein PilX
MNRNNTQTTILGSRRNYSKHTSGVALVVSLLMVVVLLGVLMAITSTLSLSSRRITGDQRATQQAQFAAESGVAQVRARLKETFALINSMSVPQSVTDTALETAIQNFCDGTALTAGNSTTNPLVTSGPGTCASSVSVAGTSKFSLFTTYITSGYPTGVTASDYWRDVFYDGGGTPKQVQQAISNAGGASTRYTLTSYGLIPIGAKRLGPSLYEIDFKLAAPLLAGEIVVGSNAVSKRMMQLSMPTQTYTLTISRPSFAQYVLFRNQTTNTSGGQLYFTNGEVFNGPVHTNQTPGFGGPAGPTFSDKFTTAASSYLGTNGLGCTTLAQLSSPPCSSMFTGASPKFAANSIPLPTNNNNQARASYGGDASNAVAVTSAELQTAWGVSSVTNGVYYSQGNGSTTSNTGSSWEGGLYVQGNVNSMKLSTSGGFQVITIVQGTTTMIFTQQSNGTWTVTVNGALVKTISASPAFNGMIYVAGSVTSLNGDGTAAADVASGSQLTLSTTGNVTINSDITYADDPRTNASATNVLGIYSSGGSVKIDGPYNQDLNVNASIMATTSGQGFGSVKYNQDIGSKSINLLGGIIEDQSQTVGTIGTPYLGYRRNYNYDPRFKLGFAPPYFPLQQQWSESAADFTQPRIIWEPKAN